MKKSFISIKKFEEEPYSKILGYPKASKRQIRSRILELEKLKGTDDLRALRVKVKLDSAYLQEEALADFASK